MAFNYLASKRICALRLAQIAGTDSTSLETSYTGSWSTMLDGSEIPITAFKDAILYIAKEIAQTIGNNASHPWRSFLYARTDTLVDNSSTPTVADDGAEIIGVWDSCAEEDTNIPLLWMPTQTISDSLNSFFDDTDLYYYNINGNYIRGTRPEFYLQGCKWSESDQSDLYDIDGDCPLPQATLSLLCDGVTAKAVQVGWVDGADVSPYYNNLYQQGLVNIANMGTNMPLTAAQNPITG